MSHFEKVSFNQFKKDCDKLGFNYENLEELYNEIKLPSRGSVCSAGYDFYCPFNINLAGIQVKDWANFTIYNEVIYNYQTIPTGIRWVTDDVHEKNLVLMCFPRSGQGFKFGVQLANTAGIIDSDYCRSDNEGHIMLKVTSEVPTTLEKGKGMMQGIITKYCITDEDVVTNVRNGGFGSTDKK